MSEAPVGYEIKESSKEPSIREEIWEVLESSGNHRFVSEEIKAAQKAVLENLPDDFWMEFKGELLAVDYEQHIYEGAKESRRLVGTIAPSEVVKGLDKRELSIRGSGIVFEALVRADRRINPKKETALATEIREFMHHPLRFGLLEEQIPGFMRNPDLAAVNEKGEIVGWTECKAGHLDSRAVEQLRYFEGNFGKALVALRKVGVATLWDHGLENVALNQGRLRLASSLERKLAVPFGVNDPSNPEALLSSEINDSERSVFLEKIAGYQIVESPFSRNDLRVATAHLVDKFIKEVGDVKTNRGI